jgi:glycosyltransferase involved in cell wall biosynthesis
MKVLFIDAAGPFGGAGRSLFELMRELKKQHNLDVKIVMQQGTARHFYEQVTSDIITVPGLTRFDNTRLTSYKGIRWLVIIREFYNLPYSIYAIIKAKILWKEVDLIHVNEITDIIPAIFAKYLFNAPLIVHVRSLQRIDKRSLRSRWLNSQLAKVGGIIAIDNNVKATLPSNLKVSVINNSFSIYHEEREQTLEKKLKNLNPSTLKVGFVGNLHYMKGIFEILEAISILRKREIEIECIIAGGETRSDSKILKYILKRFGLAQNMASETLKLINDFGISDFVHLLGPVKDISSVYNYLDVILFPTYYDAPGRPVFEAAFFSVPSIVCVVNPFPDTFVNGETGISIPPKNPRKLAEAIMYFYENREEALRMGANAKDLANKNFVSEKNAQKVYSLYCQILNSL